MKRRQGATLALVVAITLVIALLGLAFFFLIKILGGSRELQHAVDAGNLNVAKQSLRRPFLNIFNTSNSPDLVDPYLTIAKTNFAAAKDPAVGELDLLVYNRAVGQAMLVSINAISDNYGFGPPNPQGIANAKTLINVLSHPSEGIGFQLAKKLKADQQQDVSFSSIASITPMKMLNPGGANASPESQRKDVAFMARNFATNLGVAGNVIPSEFSGISPSFLPGNTVSKNGTTYIRGYSLINVPGVTDSTYPLMGVPLRPRERPHLVALTEFQDLKDSPLPGGGQQPVDTRVPPNAFRSAGSSAEIKSGLRTEANSCAIVGSVAIEGEFQASIPCGYIVVANGNGSTPNGSPGPVTVDNDAGGLSDEAYTGASNDIFTDLLMNQQVFVMPNGAMDTNVNDITNIQQFKQDNPGQPLPQGLVDALDGPAPKQSAADGIQPGQTPVGCDNYNSTPTAPNANPTCFNNLGNMATTYGFSLPNGGNGTQIGGLMAIEKYKAQVINPRPGGGPAIVSGVNNKCTGLKSFTLGGIPSSAPIQFGQPGTVKNLLDRFRSYPPTAQAANLIYNQLKTKMFQIRPESSQADIDGVLANSLPMGAIRYIWMDPNTRQWKFTDQSALPSYINPTAINPDGTETLATTGWLQGNRNFVNIEGEQGYPSPWDCFGGPEDQTKSEALWRRSSGYNCLQGILRFMNCANGGSTIPWDCPC